MLHTFVALVQDKAGVLTRVASLFRRLNINIVSLTGSQYTIASTPNALVVVPTFAACSAVLEWCEHLRSDERLNRQLASIGGGRLHHHREAIWRHLVPRGH